MAISEVIRDALAADATLVGLLTGGIYSYEQTGRNGISRVTTPTAYNGFLLPCAVIKAGDKHDKPVEPAPSPTPPHTALSPAPIVPK